MNINYCYVSLYLSKNFISCISSLKPFTDVFKKTTNTQVKIVLKFNRLLANNYIYKFIEAKLIFVQIGHNRKRVVLYLICKHGRF